MRLSGQIPDPAPDPSALSADFAETIRILYQAGLVPLPADAVPLSRVKVEGRNVSHALRLRGGEYMMAWTWREEDGKHRLLLGNEIPEADLRFSDAEGETPDLPSGAAPVFRVERAAPPSDVESILRFLPQIGKGFDHDPAQMYGTYLILALRMHETGHIPAANRIADALAKSPGLKESRKAALGVLAEHAYMAAFDRYLRGADLPAFVDEIADLEERWGDLWHNRDLIRFLLREWRDALLATDDDIPASLTPGQRALYRELCAFASGVSPAFTTFLNVNPLLYTPDSAREFIQARHTQLFGADASAADDLGPTLRLAESIVRMGPEAIPVFAALLESPKVLPFSSRSEGLYFFRPSPNPGTMPAVKRLSFFPHPLRVSSLATFSIRGMLPVRNSQVLVITPDMAAALYRDLQGKAPLDIALYYLDNVHSYTYLGSPVRQKLLELGDEGVRDKLRKRILEDINLLALAPTYLDTVLTEGESGKAFRQACLDKILLLHREDLDNPASARGPYLRNNLEKFFGWKAPVEEAP